MAASPVDLFYAQMEAGRRWDELSNIHGIPPSPVPYTYIWDALWRIKPLYGYCMDELIGGPWHD